MTTREQKSFRFQVKAIDDAEGLIEAYGSVFDRVDQGDDVVRPGAFKRTIQNSKSRVQAGKAKFLAMMLWQHDPNQPIGGWTDLKEDTHGLLCKGQIVLSTQLGRECYELIKAGVINEFSIGYDIPSGGATYDSKTGYRELTELRLWEVSPVTFAMQEEALLVGVKAMETKAICGNTSGPIGSRDEAWDGGKAKGQIWAAAEKADGSLDEGLCKKYFMVQNGDPQQKGSYSYPFWYVGSDPHICVGAVKAIAAAVGGARNADAPDGLKSKVETLYSRINKQYPDDPQLTPPWKDDGKSQGKHMQKKTLLEHYAEEMCEDLLEDWQDVYLCALTNAVLDALKIGDATSADIAQALDDFKMLVLEKFVTQAQECNLSQYLTDNASTPADYTMQYGSESKPDYGYMSRHTSLQRKAGRSISQSNADKIQGHVNDVHDMANKAMSMMQEHTKALHAAANDLASMIKKPEDDTAPASDENDEQDTKKPQPPEEKPPKKAASLVQARGADPHTEASTVDEQELEAMLRRLRELRKPAPTTTVVA